MPEKWLLWMEEHAPKDLYEECCASIQWQAEWRDRRIKDLDGRIEMALSELGVPGPMTPAPVANAVEFLKTELNILKVGDD